MNGKSVKYSTKFKETIVSLYSSRIIFKYDHYEIEPEPAIRALDNAIKFKKTSNGVIFHTD